MKMIKFNKEWGGHLAGDTIAIRSDEQLEQIKKTADISIIDVPDESETKLILVNPAEGVWTTTRVPIGSEQEKAYFAKFDADANILTDRTDNVVMGVNNASAIDAANAAADAGQPENTSKAVTAPIVPRDEKVVIEDLKKAATVEDVDRILHDDTRPKVVAAADARRKALTS